MMTKAIGYIRVSTADQENSLEVQEKRIRDYCIFKNIYLEEIFIDENISGFKELYKRPSGKKLSEQLKEIKTIIAIKPDRLFRNVIDALVTVDKWSKNEIDLHIVDMGGLSFSTKTAIGRLMFTNVIAYAEFERNITSERTKAVLKNKKDTQKVYSGPILGFDNVEGQLIPNDSEMEIINTIKSLSKKHNPRRISRILNNVGYRGKSLKKFYPSTIQYILNNKLYN